MPSHSLPENPSFEHLRKQARRLLRQVLAGDAGALAQATGLHPRAHAALPAFALADAQLVVARSHGFPSWPRLKQHLELVERFTWRPSSATRQPGGEPLAHEFLRHACLVYGDWRPESLARARALLAAHRELEGADVFTAAVTGDVLALESHLAADPSLVHQRGGPYRWQPLLYACYSRLDAVHAEHSTLAAARTLLAHGADPNAGFLWQGNVPPFTALTGAFGEGEDGNNQPPHAHAHALARLLLDAGADPNDGQTLYNRHFHARDDHLELLLEHGLGQDRGGPWYQRLGDRLDSPQQLLIEELCAAARRNFFARVRLLVAHGAPIDQPSRRDGRTPHAAAVYAGNRDIADYLLRQGAPQQQLARDDDFAAACAAGDEPRARALLASDSTLLQRLDARRRAELVHQAAAAGRADGLRLMAALGFDISAQLHNSPLHQAAWAGNLEIAALLVDLGADTSARDPDHDATPLGWAVHNRQPALAAFLADFADVFDALQCGMLGRVARLLQANPDLAHARDRQGRPLACLLRDDLQSLDAAIALLRGHGADLDARDDDGRTAVDRAMASGDHEFAARLRALGLGGGS